MNAGQTSDSFQGGTYSASPSPAAPPSSAARAAAEEEMTIVASPDVPAESLAKLRATASRAVSYFREHFGPVSKPLRFEVGAASKALRTGYNFESGAVCLPHLENVQNAGLDSVDIINHEIFHALMFDAYPQHCGKEHMESNDSVRLHEGLADYFAHRLEPDSTFGENYFISGAGLREYRNGLSVSLSAGAHAQGNAITSHLLAQDVANQDVAGFLKAADFSLDGLARSTPALGEALGKDASFEIRQSVGSYPASRKNRYRLDHDVPLTLAFTANESLRQAHPDFRVVWTDKSGLPSKKFIFEETEANAFSVSCAPEADSEKMIARYYDGDVLVGFEPFYFGLKLEESPRP